MDSSDSLSGSSVFLGDAFAPKKIRRRHKKLTPSDLIYNNDKWSLTPVKLLGQGSYGAVVHAVDRGFHYAVKIVNLNETKWESEIEREIDNLRRAEDSAELSKLLPKLYDTHKQTIGDCTYIFLLMELIIGTTLYKIIYYSDPDITQLTKKLLTGLSTLHRHGFIHRDIKPDNVIITESGQLKFLDLGFSCFKYREHECFSAHR